MYYACNNANNNRSYFLTYEEKNANYHLYDILIYTLGHRVDDDFNFMPFHKEQLGPVSAFGGMLKVYENKLQMGGLDNARTRYGQFTSTINGSDDALDGSVTEWFERFSRSADILRMRLLGRKPS